MMPRGASTCEIRARYLNQPLGEKTTLALLTVNSNRCCDAI
jgi:hypothetical protein